MMFPPQVKRGLPLGDSRFRGLWKSVIIFFLISAVSLLVWGIKHREEPENMHDYIKIRNLASVTKQTDPRPRREASLTTLTYENVTLTLTFKEGTTSTVQFDFCEVVSCPKYEHTYGWMTKTLCIITDQCGPATNKYGKLVSYYNCDCEDWGWATLNTGAEGLGKDPNPGLKDRLKMLNAPSSYHMCRIGVGRCNPLRLTLTDPKLTDGGLYVVQGKATTDGPAPQGLIRIIVKPAKKIMDDQVRHTTDAGNEVPGVETGMADGNLWLRWVQYTALSQRSTDCIVCSGPKPLATPVPSRFRPLSPEFSCILTLFTEEALPLHHTCQGLHWDYPPVEYDTPPLFKVSGGPFDCIVSDTAKGPNVGSIIEANCSNTHNANDYLYNSVLRQTTPRADLWWWCGGRTIYPILPRDWTGRCALVQLILPFYILPVNDATYKELISPHTHANRRTKRGADSPKGAFDDQVYIDAIGVPRGVPNEFKARNQVAAGFESIFFWRLTISKTVDWVNYIYYNQQRFVNFTRDAISGLHAQLAKTSLMALQNRIALDMILAEKGGVCQMFGTACCTFIPNNTAPDGSVTRAMAGLTALRQELAENSGVTNSFTDWLESMFGNWKNTLLSIVITLCVVVTGLLVVCGCGFPCIRGLLQGLIASTFSKTQIQGNQLCVEDEEELELLMATV